MARTKKYNYVLVLGDEGGMFVTKLGEGHTAYWKKDGKPEHFNYEFAKDMAVGLTWNGNPAFVVVTEYELTSQPFRYDVGHFKWVMNDKTE